MNESLRPDDEVNLPILQGGPGLGLNLEIRSIADSMHQCVHAAVGDWQENVQPAAGLLRQQRPQAEFEDLPGGAGLVARPRG